MIKAVVFDIGQTLIEYNKPLNWSKSYRPALERAAEACNIYLSETDFQKAVNVLSTYNTMESKTARGRRYMQEHGFAPEQTLYIGDTVHDYETASDLGVDCILFSGGQQSPKLLKRCGVPVYDTFADIANQLTADM